MIEIVEGYCATEDGRIWSIKSQSFISQRINRSGYYCVNLSIRGKCKTFIVHRLIAKAFLPNPLNKDTINHKDGNKLNNCVENLEWCTQKENMQHAWRSGLLHPAKGMHTLNGRFLPSDIYEIRSLYSTGLSQRAIADIYNVTKGTIQQILNGSTYAWVQ